MPAESVKIAATEAPPVPAAPAPDAPMYNPVEDSFEKYEARRQDEIKREFAAEVVETPVAEAPTPAPVPESTESAPAAEVPPAGSTTPEPTEESGTTVSNQEEKDKDKPKGIPQTRLDEITKLRRTAEAERDAEKRRADALEQEVATLKAQKPAEPPAPVPPTEAAPAEKPKPVAPEVPTLETSGGDWDEYEKALKKYHKEEYPTYVESLTDWKDEQREAARVKKAAEAKPPAAPAAAAPAATQTDTEREWNERMEAGKTKYPDWDDKLLALPQDPANPVSSPGMLAALLAYDDAEDIVYYLASNPAEAQRIAKATAHKDGQSNRETQKILATAHQELSGVRSKISAHPPAAATFPPAPGTPKPPDNPKPPVSRAPRPPVPVNDKAASPAKALSEINEFAEWERARKPTLIRR